MSAQLNHRSRRLSALYLIIDSRPISQYPRGSQDDKPASFDGVHGTYNFSVQEVLTSSLQSWIMGGYQYDFAQDQVEKARNAPTDHEAFHALDGLQGAKPGDAGMFNLPVVVVQDMNDW